MAEAGIKISQLANVNAKENDYTVVVQDGITRKARISSITNLATSGQTANVNEIRSDLTTLSTYSHSLYTNQQVDDKIGTANSNIEKVQNNLNTAVNDLTSRIYNTNSTVDSIQNSLNSISSLIDDPELLSSLTSMISLLSGEDGQTSLSNIALNIASISNDLIGVKSALETDIRPSLNETSSAVANILNDAFNAGSFSNENNSLLLVNGNDSYDFSYDRYSFANVSTAMSKVLCAEVSGSYESGGNLIGKTAILTNGVPSIDDITAQYGSLTIQDPEVGELSNVIMLSSISLQNSVDGRYLLSTIYQWSFTGFAPILSATTSSTNSISYPGDSTFSLDMVPIRAGMFSIYGPTASLDLKLSGNSDFKLYYANQAELISGESNSVDVIVNGEKISRRSAVSGYSSTDMQLGLIDSRQLKGGSTITFATSELTGSSLSLNANSLIAAIYAKRLPSESNPLEVKLLSAWSTVANANIENTMLQYKVKGGVTGDRYLLSVAYYPQEEGATVSWATWKDNLQGSLTIDNANLLLEPINIDTLESKISSSYNVVLVLGKENDPSNAISSNAFAIGDYIAV